MTDATPDYARLIGLLNALAVDHECDEEHDAKETCDKSAEAIRTLLESNAALERERDELKHDVSRYVEIASDEATRAEAAEAKLAEAMKVIGQIDNALNDQFAAGIEEREGGSARRQERLMKSGEELRRAARKFLKENGNGE